MSGLLADIASPRLLVLKGVLFVVLGFLAAALLVVGVSIGMEWWGVLVLHLVGVWAWCRAYYFAFHVLERYAGLGGRYAGLWAAARAAMSAMRRADGREP